MVRNIRLTLAYDGTEFSGWQVQNNARTVQGDIEEALRRMHDHPVRIQGAGRTDSGVHASGQVIAFDLDWRHGIDDLLAALFPRLAACQENVTGPVEIPAHPLIQKDRGSERGASPQPGDLAAENGKRSSRGGSTRSLPRSSVAEV